MGISYLVKGDASAYWCASLEKEKGKQRQALVERISLYLKSEMRQNRCISLNA
jgi:hypothetical protein